MATSFDHWRTASPYEQSPSAARLEDQLRELDDESDKATSLMTRGLQVDCDCARSDYTLDDADTDAPVVYCLDCYTTIEVARGGSFKFELVELVRHLAGNLGFDLVQREEVARG